MKRIKREHETQIEPIIDRLRDAASAVESAYGDVQVATAKMNTAIEEYNEVLSDARDLKEDITVSLAEWEGGRSDKWRESDAYRRFMDWYESWNDLELDAIEGVDNPDLPDMVHADALADADITQPEE